MVLTSLQSQRLINWFNHLNINHPVQMADVNDVLSTFEENIILEIQQVLNYIFKKQRRYIKKLTR